MLPTIVFLLIETWMFPGRSISRLLQRRLRIHGEYASASFHAPRRVSCMGYTCKSISWQWLWAAPSCGPLWDVLRLWGAWDDIVSTFVLESTLLLCCSPSHSTSYGLIRILWKKLQSQTLTVLGVSLEKKRLSETSPTAIQVVGTLNWSGTLPVTPALVKPSSPVQQFT